MGRIAAWGFVAIVIGCGGTSSSGDGPSDAGHDAAGDLPDVAPAIGATCARLGDGGQCVAVGTACPPASSEVLGDTSCGSGARCCVSGGAALPDAGEDAADAGDAGDAGCGNDYLVIPCCGNGMPAPDGAVCTPAAPYCASFPSKCDPSLGLCGCGPGQGMGVPDPTTHVLVCGC